MVGHHGARVRHIPAAPDRSTGFLLGSELAQFGKALGVGRKINAHEIRRAAVERARMLGVSLWASLHHRIEVSRGENLSPTVVVAVNFVEIEILPHESVESIKILHFRLQGLERQAVFFLAYDTPRKGELVGHVIARLGEGGEVTTEGSTKGFDFQGVAQFRSIRQPKRAGRILERRPGAGREKQQGEQAKPHFSRFSFFSNISFSKPRLPGT